MQTPATNEHALTDELTRSLLEPNESPPLFNETRIMVPAPVRKRRRGAMFAVLLLIAAGAYTFIERPWVRFGLTLPDLTDRAHHDTTPAPAPPEPPAKPTVAEPAAKPQEPPAAAPVAKAAPTPAPAPAARPKRPRREVAPAPAGTVVTRDALFQRVFQLEKKLGQQPAETDPGGELLARLGSARAAARVASTNDQRLEVSRELDGVESMLAP